MDISFLLPLVTDNIGVIFGVGASLLGLGNNFQLSKVNAVKAADEHFKNNPEIVGDDEKLDIAVTYFYNLFLSRFVPAGITRIVVSLVIPQDVIRKIIKDEYHKLKEVGIEKAEGKIDRIIKRK